MESDFAIVDLPAHLAVCCRVDRVLVEAVELCGGAMFRGAAHTWEQRADGYHVPQGGWLDVPEEHWPTLERLFVEARKQVPQADYHDARHSPKPASRPLPQYSPMTMKKSRRMQ